MSSPLISVVIPAYNHERYIEDAIRSAIDQTYENLELIIIDDGSTDGTWNVIRGMKEECQRRFSRIDFSTQTNCGTCITYNRLFEKAAGEYIYIINSDDIAHESAIEELHEFLNENPEYVLAVGDADYIDGNGNRAIRISIDNNSSLTLIKAVSDDLIKNIEENNIPYSPDTESIKLFTTMASFYRHLRNDVDFDSNSFGEYSSFFISNYIPNGYLVRSHILKNITLTNEAKREDYYMMFQISKSGKFKFINKVLHHYRYHGDNASLESVAFDKSLDETREYEIMLCKKNMSESEFGALIQNVTAREEKLRNRQA